MQRKALLIGNTSGLEGIGVDIERTTEFLKSSLGGKWVDSEITRLFDPSRKTAIDAINRIRNGYADYVFFLFTGHGCHYGQTELSLGGGEKLSESELNGLADRQLSIFDCCRVERQILRKATEAYAYTFDALDTTRKRYDHRIMQAAKQHTRLYSCSVGESSYDTPQGAMYLSNLLNAAAQIPVGAHFATVEDAHSAARAKTIVEAAQQGNKQTPAAIQPKLPPEMQLILSIR